MKSLQRRLIELSYKYRLSHIGSCMTMLPVLYEVYLIKDKEDKVFLSAAHSHLSHLIVREHFNEIPDAEKLLVEHGIHCDVAAGCDFSGGSLGHSGIGVGAAYANPKRKVYLLSTDGESNEGSFFEALRIANELRLKNLFWIINANGFSAYKDMNYDLLSLRVKCFNSKAQVIKTDSTLPFAEGIDSHYKVMNETEYQQALEFYA